MAQVPWRATGRPWLISATVTYDGTIIVGIVDGDNMGEGGDEWEIDAGSGEGVEEGRIGELVDEASHPN